jgi:hypothetical protein
MKDESIIIDHSRARNTPRPDTDSHGNIIGDKTIPIAVLDIRTEVHFTSYKQQKLPAAYEALKKAGFRWLTYKGK